MELEECCRGLESAKVTERSRSIKQIKILLQNEKTVDKINTGNTAVNWDHIIFSTYVCLLNDAEKYTEDLRKKNSSTVSRELNGQTFFDVIAIAIKENNNLNYSEIFSYVKKFLDRNMMKDCYGKPCLTTLRDSILYSARFRSHLEGSDWTELFSILKDLCGTQKLLTEYNYVQVECLGLLIRWGPLYSLPADMLREEFSFVSKLCETITQSSLRSYIEAIIKLAYQFCQHTAKDNRMACCKLGEEAVAHFVQFYEIGTREDNTKIHLVDFFLFLVVLHHPKGVREVQLGAYAYNSENWNRFLRSMYWMMCDEIDLNLKCRNRNTTLFITKDERQDLYGKFVDLFVEVSRQVLNKADADVSIAATSSRQIKRQKSEINMRNLINFISESKKWPWIQLVYSLLKKYPDMIDESDYIVLLQVLANLQREYEDQDLRHHIYRGLLVLEEIQDSVCTSTANDEVTKLWKLIGEATLKEVGLNLCSEETDPLLQRLLVKGKIIQPENLLEIFNAPENLTKNKIQTIQVYGENYNFSSSIKTILIKCILNRDNLEKLEYISSNLTARVLSCLVLKHWPIERDTPFEKTEKHDYPFRDVADIYLKTSFEKSLVTMGSCADGIKTFEIPSVDLESKKLLLTTLQKFTENFQNSSNYDLETTLNVAILHKNLLYQFEKYNILTDEEEVSDISSTLCKLMDHFVSEFSKYSNSFNEINSKKVIRYLEIVYYYLDEIQSQFICETVISSISSSFFKQLYNIMTKYCCASSKQLSSGDLKFQVTQRAIKVFSKYCFLCYDGTISNTQLFAVEAIRNLEFNFIFEYHYKLSRIFLSEFKNSKPGCLTEDSIKVFMEFLKNVCSARYHLHDSALEILSSLKAVLSHLCIIQSDTDTVSYLTSLVVPFHVRKSNYGPKVSVSIIECLELLCKLDPNFGFAKWIEGEEIIMSICNFLCSDFQEVRFQAILSLTKFFSNEKINSDFHSNQALIFKKIFQLNLQVFEIQGNISDERRVDETVTRTASALHSFASLAICSTTWLQESLFSLLRITHMKKLIGLDKIIKLIARSTNVSERDLLENNLEYLLDKWCTFGFRLDDFPIHLYDLETKIDFCVKYLDTVTPFLIEHDRDTLEAIAESIGKNKNEVIRESCPKILSNSICKEDKNVLKDLLTKNDSLLFLIQNLSLPVFNESINNSIEQVLLHLLQVISDEDDFRHHFGEAVIFPRLYMKSITVKEFKEALIFLETEICNTPDILSLLITNQPGKVHKLTLELKLKIQKVQVDKSRLFHAYFMISNRIIGHTKRNSAFLEYFIRDTVNYLLNLMERFPIHPELSVLSSLALFKFCKQIIREYYASISPMLHMIVNKLSNISMRHERISSSCIDVLKIIIIENSDKFTSSIQTLDPFPRDEKYEALEKIYNRIKYEDQTVSLEKDIKYFLQCGYETRFSDTREEGLKHLKTQLSTKKEELNALYLKLREIRGFSEDCEKSLLHQLVCMLVKLSCSKQLNVAIEACKCLGELGPANLFTLILQPEKSLKIENMSPSEIFCGQVISHLFLYIISADIELVAASSEGLIHILNSKDGKKVLKNAADFSLGENITSYLTPFLPLPKQKANFPIQINENIFVTNLNDEDLWSPEGHMSHTDWVTKLTCTILETFSERGSMKYLLPICKLKAEFCEDILPYLLHLIITITKNQLINFVFEKIKYFFERHWVLSSDDRLKNSKVIALNRSALRCMLNCVHYIRLQKNYARSPRQMIIEKLDLDYLHLSRAANFCSQHFAAILYAELWCQLEFNKITTSNPVKQSVGYKMLDIIYENVDENTRQSLEDILRDSYKTLGDFDALSGCGTSILLDHSRRVEHYKELGRWDQALLHYEIETSNNKDSSKDLIDSLKHSGLYKVPLLCNQTNEPDFECLWRLSQWNFSEPKNNNDQDNDKSSNQFEKYRYFALKCLHENDQYHFKDIIERAIISEMHRMKHVSLESCKNVYDILARLQSLREMENFAEIKNNPETLEELLNTWKSQNIMLQNDFCYIEPIKQQRIIILKDVNIREEYSTTILPQLMLNFAEYARSEGHLNVAARTLGNMYFIENLSNDMKARIQFEDAQFSWSLNDKISAHHILKHLYNANETDPRVKSAALKLAGKWFIETLSENKHTIISNYLLESLNLYNSVETKTSEDHKNIIDTYNQLGRFADKEYQQILSHINSEMFQQKIKNMKKSKQTADEIKSAFNRKKPSVDENKAFRIHQQQSLIDEHEIDNAEKEKSVLLKYALKYYLVNLAMSDENNMHIFRVFSLFLENKNDPEISEIIRKYLPKIPTYKYITILPQMIPHLSSSSDTLFNEQINTIIQKCAEDHPHHTIPLILSLANSNKDREYTNSTAVTSTNDSRISSASDLIKKLKKNKDLNAIITEMEFVSSAIIELAYYKPSSVSKNAKVIDIPAHLDIRKVNNFSNTLLPTCSLEVSKSGRYESIVSIHSFGDEYYPVGGINAPKRVACRGTDGKVRSQLVKGQDDLRQDAVMQQVFTIMNSLLFVNKSTKDLIIRTYKIMPLSMRSGVLEWVDNSMPIGVYLVGESGENKKPGAHEMYRPRDKKPSECRNMISEAAKHSAEVRLKVFNSACKSMKPVFHKFFEYSFPQPSIWYERKRAYTYSLATSSMCGYILGLGDRHVQNILIDKSTAEVIHIDFGIAFEQGRTLQTPETVPFRLTRDIVDGMGVSGVEGIFRKACEKTMEVMRQNSQTILTILEVLLYDPLYTWTVTSAEANKRQKGRQDDSVGESSSLPSDSDKNITAQRALSRLKSKLHGTENGYPVSLEHQVGTLIQQAQDPANLCKLFHGWQACL